MSDQSTRTMLEPILDGGVRNPYFFNGRLLTARDLQDEQAAQQRHRRRLGRAIGSGVVEGLSVSVESATVTKAVLRVSAGLAITAEGQAFELARAINLEVAPQVEAVPPKGGLFAACAAARVSAKPTGTGVYVLLAAPDSDFSAERAPASGLGADGRITGCGSRYSIDGACFRLIQIVPGELPAALDPTGLESQINPPKGESADAALRRASLLRSRLAHLCAEGAGLAAVARSPSAQTPGAGLLSALTAREGDDVETLRRRLTACDVPLALVYWTAGGIEFVDMWAVRRRPAAPAPAASWPIGPALGDPLTAEASLLQFEAHLAWLGGRRSAAQRKALRALDYLRYLPAAGALPLADYDYARFFDGLPYRDNGPQPGEQSPWLTGPPVIEGAQAAALFRTALGCPPIDLRAATVEGAARPELIWLYRVRENKQAIDEKASPSPAPYLIFASGHLPELGLARVDLARWGYSNYV